MEETRVNPFQDRVVGCKMAAVSDGHPLRGELRKMLQYGDLPFRDFMEIALYHPQFGYYATSSSPIGKAADYVTAPLLSPVFSFCLARLQAEFLGHVGDAMSTVVDIGCGDGELIRELKATSPANVRYVGVDRELDRIPAPLREDPEFSFVRTIEEIKAAGPTLIISNELFDAFPFDRLVQRGEHIHELWVADRGDSFDWTEHEAAAPYEDYFVGRGIELAEGQFADISLEWEAYYSDIVRHTPHGLVVTFDYGEPEEKLFRFRRFGTAAAYSGQRVSRDLLANPGEQDLTAHINFTDLQRAGERHGYTTLFFGRLANFLLLIGALEHPLLQPAEGAIESLQQGIEIVEQREQAKQLVLPDGIGNDMRVLVQGKGVPLEGWSFQKKLY
jgi:SAM-dependent MidA family methyltransferase